MDTLMKEIYDLDHVPGLLSDEQTRTFFAIIPLDTLFGLLKTEAGSLLLLSAVPYLDAAMQSAMEPLRRLAAQQFSALLLQHSHVDPSCEFGSRSGSQIRRHAIEQLLLALQDQSTGVAVEAENGLSAWAALDVTAAEEMLSVGGSSPSPCPGSVAVDEGRRNSIYGLALESTSSTVRMRLLSTLVSVASRGGSKVAEIVKKSGQVSTLLSRELSSAAKDPLSALSALSSVSELSSVHGGLASQMLAAILGALPQLLNDPMLKPGALRAAAMLLREFLDEAASADPIKPASRSLVDVGDFRSSGSPDQGRGHGTSKELIIGPAGIHVLLEGICHILDDTGSGSLEDEVSALDAVGQLALSRRGAELILVENTSLVAAVLEKALGRASSTEVRVAALHSLALLSGLQRAHAGEERRSAFLSDQAEEALRMVTYEATSTASIIRSPPESLLQFIEQPFPDLREAAFHAASALSLRPWFAADVCRCKGLMDRILDPGSETGGSAASWRYSLVTALWSTIQAVSRLGLEHPDEAHKATLSAAALRVQAACKEGPFGLGLNRDLTARDVPLVATIP